MLSQKFPPTRSVTPDQVLSLVERTVESVGQPTRTVMVDGVKASEVAWIGLRPWLEAVGSSREQLYKLGFTKEQVDDLQARYKDGKLSKEQVLEFVQENDLEIITMMRGAPFEATPEQRASEVEELTRVQDDLEARASDATRRLAEFNADPSRQVKALLRNLYEDPSAVDEKVLAEQVKLVGDKIIAIERAVLEREVAQLESRSAAIVVTPFELGVWSHAKQDFVDAADLWRLREDLINEHLLGVAPYLTRVREVDARPSSRRAYHTRRLDEHFPTNRAIHELSMELQGAKFDQGVLNRLMDWFLVQGDTDFDASYHREASYAKLVGPELGFPEQALKERELAAQPRVRRSLQPLVGPAERLIELAEAGIPDPAQGESYYATRETTEGRPAGAPDVQPEEFDPDFGPFPHYGERGQPPASYRTSYSIPGGKNYREVALVLRVKGRPAATRSHGFPKGTIVELRMADREVATYTIDDIETALGITGDAAVVTVEEGGKQLAPPAPTTATRGEVDPMEARLQRMLNTIERGGGVRGAPSSQALADFQRIYLDRENWGTLGQEAATLLNTLEETGVVTPEQAAQVRHFMGLHGDTTGAFRRILFVDEIQSDWLQSARKVMKAAVLRAFRPTALPSKREQAGRGDTGQTRGALTSDSHAREHGYPDAATLLAKWKELRPGEVLDGPVIWNKEGLKLWDAETRALIVENVKAGREPYSGVKTLPRGGFDFSKQEKDRLETALARGQQETVDFVVLSLYENQGVFAALGLTPRLEKVEKYDRDAPRVDPVAAKWDPEITSVDRLVPPPVEESTAWVDPVDAAQVEAEPDPVEDYGVPYGPDYVAEGITVEKIDRMDALLRSGRLNPQETRAVFLDMLGYILTDLPDAGNRFKGNAPEVAPRQLGHGAPLRNAIRLALRTKNPEILTVLQELGLDLAADGTLGLTPEQELLEIEAEMGGAETSAYRPGSFFARYSEMTASNNAADAELQRVRNMEKVAKGAPHTSLSVPAPLAATWPAVAMRRVIRYAAEQGYDGFGWATGEIQERRYRGTSVFSEVGSISWQKTSPELGFPDGSKTVTLNMVPPQRGEEWIVFPNETALIVNEAGIVLAAPSSELQGQPLARVVGPRHAATIMAGGVTVARPSADFVGPMPTTKAAAGVIHPENLFVGAMGMKGFYDQRTASDVRAMVSEKRWRPKGKTKAEVKASVKLAPLGDVQETGAEWKPMVGGGFARHTELVYDGPFYAPASLRELAETHPRLAPLADLWEARLQSMPGGVELLGILNEKGLAGVDAATRSMVEAEFRQLVPAVLRVAPPEVAVETVEGEPALTGVQGDARAALRAARARRRAGALGQTDIEQLNDFLKEALGGTSRRRAADVPVWTGEVSEEMRTDVANPDAEGTRYFAKPISPETVKILAERHNTTLAAMTRTVEESGYEVIQPGQPAATEEEANGTQPSLEDEFDEPSLTSIQRVGLGVKEAFGIVADWAARAVRKDAAHYQGSTEILTERDIINRLTHYLKVPVVTGGYRAISETAGRVTGLYKVDEQIIRMRRYKKLDEVAIQIGHHVAKHLLGVKYNPKAAQELEMLGLATSPEDATTQYLREEGEAEFFKLWAISPDKAKSLAPTYFAAFERKLDAIKDTELGKELRIFAKDSTAFFKQDLLAQAHAAVSMGEKGDRWEANQVLLLMETNFFNDLAPIKAAVKGMGGGRMPENLIDDAFRLAELARGSTAKAYGWLKFGIRTYDGKKQSAGIEEIIRRHRGRMDEFAVYMVARHVPEMDTRGIQTAMSLEAAEKAREEYAGEFEESAKQVDEFLEALLDYTVEGMMLDQAAADRMKSAYQFYIPMQPISDVAGIESGQRPSKMIADPQKPSQYKARKLPGVAAITINPFESIVRNTHITVNAVESNRAMLALVDQANTRVKTLAQTQADRLRKHGEEKKALKVEARIAKADTEKGMVDLTKNLAGGTGRYLDRISTPMATRMLNLKHVEKAAEAIMENAGVQIPKDAQGKSVLNFEAMVKVFEPVTEAYNKYGIVSVMRDGKREYYQVHDRMLYEALTMTGAAESGVQSTGFIDKLMVKPATFLRTAATMTLEFLGRNPWRDTWEASILSKYGFIPLWHTIYGAAQVLAAHSPTAREWLDKMNKGRAQEVYELFLNSGAGGRSLVSMDRDFVGQQLRKMGVKQRFNFMKSVVRSPYEGLQALQEAMENASRIGEFMLGVRKEGATAEGYARAAAAAAEVTINFKRAGRWTREANRIIAFFNAGVQGKVRIYEEAKRRPVQFAARGAMNITSLTLALWLINRDDDDYWELPQWERNAYWHIPRGLGKGHKWIRIPKPWELGVLFGNLPEALLNHFSGRQDFEDRPIHADYPNGILSSEAGWNLLTGLIPTAYIGIIQVTTNWDYFRDRPIVNYWDTELEPDLQYSFWTSETAKSLSGRARWQLPIGAAYIDSLKMSYLAGYGRYITDVSDFSMRTFKRVFGDEEGPAVSGRAWTESWGIRAFYRRAASGSSSESVQEIYKNRKDARGKDDSIAKYEKAGRYADAEALKEKYADILNPAATKARNHALDVVIPKIRDTMDKIRANRWLSLEQREEELQLQNEAMTDAARIALGKRAIYKGRRTRTMKDILKSATTWRRQE